MAQIVETFRWLSWPLVAPFPRAQRRIGYHMNLWGDMASLSAALRRRRDLRAFASMGSAGASSATNFLAAILVARAGSVLEFGRFSLLFSLYLIALAFVRSFTTEPLMTRRQTLSPRECQRADAAVLWLSAIVGIAVGAAGLIGVSIATELTNMIVIFCIGFPALLVQDAYRFIAFARMEPRWAFMLDMTWLVSIPVAALICTAAGLHSASTMTGVWIAGAVVSVFAGYRVFPMPLGAPQGVWWVRRNITLVGPYAGEAALGVGATQGSAAALVTVGLSANAGWRGAGTLVGPITTVVLGVQSFALPVMVRRFSSRGFKGLVAPSVAVTVTLTATALGWAGIVHLIPDSIGALLLGESWQASVAVLPQASLWMAGVCAAVGGQLAMRAALHAKTGLWIRAASAGVLVSTLLVLVTVSAPFAALWAFAIGSWTSALLNWGVLLWIARRSSMQLEYRSEEQR